MSVLWLLGLGGALAQTHVCVDILTNFEDADYQGPVQGGDFWESNVARPARGVEITVIDDVAPVTYTVGADGCLTVGATQTNPLDPAFTVKVRSKAVVNGVSIKATDGRSANRASDPPNASSNWPGFIDTVSFQVPYASTNATLTVSTGDQRWNLLAVAMWAMHRNTFGLGTFSSRDCCLDVDAATAAGQYDATEGTCTDPAHHYANGFAAWQGATDLELYSNGSGNSSRTLWDVGIGDWVSEPAVGVVRPNRFLIAHELGHVIVAKRMGAFTRRWDHAKLDECLGDYKANLLVTPAGNHAPKHEDVDDVDTQDTAVPGTKGAFTKEYQSMAAREGWATFFAVWLFNRRTQANGQMDWWTIHDLDRDGTVDNNYDPDTVDTANPRTEAFMGDGIVDLGINPVLVTPHGTAPLDASAVGWDWLEHLVVASDAPGGDPAFGCGGTLVNRGTEYDWARFFWDMTLTAGGGILPRDLADLYVDMCPTNWEGGDGPTAPVIDRLESSAVHQGAAVEAEWNTRKVWGQDH